MLSAGNLELRRATQSDLQAVIGLQRAAYARNRVLLGVEPLPLQADYTAIFRDYEVWVAGDDAIMSVLVLEPRLADLLIWSIATDPRRQQAGLGRAMLASPGPSFQAFRFSGLDRIHYHYQAHSGRCRRATARNPMCWNCAHRPWRHPAPAAEVLATLAPETGNFPTFQLFEP